MIEPNSVETVLQREHALHLVRLDHRAQHVPHRGERCARAPLGARQIIRNRQNGAEIIGRVTPFRGEPGIVEVQPAYRRADVEGRADRIEFPGRAGHTRAPLQRGPWHHGPEQFRAGRIFQCLQATADRIGQAMPGGLVRQLAEGGLVEHVIGDSAQQLIRSGPLR